ncbi:MAG: hypothetical protein HYV09_39760, partial [Deltaproteobacteria bacterium]|nr:hypothetical protein [Deltaproteobacteria bacterium]
CSDDRLSSVDKAGVSSSCTPYRCGADGNCLKACATSDDCAPGTVCDATVKACVGVAAATEDDGGGCAIGSRSSPRSFGAALAALLLAGVLRRRSRRAGRAGEGTQLPG